MANLKDNEKIVDYYEHFGLDRNEDLKAIRTKIMKIQGEIRSNMSNGSLNSPDVLEILQEEFELTASAIKVFRNDKRREDYDKYLNSAYDSGIVVKKDWVTTKELIKELEILYGKGDYYHTILKCCDAIKNNVNDYRIYILLAQSYLLTKVYEKAIATINRGLDVCDDKILLLKAGVRIAVEGKSNFNLAQSYINRMLDIEADSVFANIEQVYIYLKMGKEKIAFELIDDFVTKHSDDIMFRKSVAYDLIGYSYSYYVKDKEDDSYMIISEDDYNKCLYICEKAKSLYCDNVVQKAIDNVKFYGTIEFDEENRIHVYSLFFGGIMYMLGGIVFLPMIVLGILLIYSGIRLYMFSRRPYWQINRFYMTGERRKGEKKYIIIGKIFTGYLKWVLKLFFKFVKFTYKLIFFWL